MEKKKKNWLCLTHFETLQILAALGIWCHICAEFHWCWWQGEKLNPLSFPDSVGHWFWLAVLDFWSKLVPIFCHFHYWTAGHHRTHWLCFIMSWHIDTSIFKIFVFVVILSYGLTRSFVNRRIHMWAHFVYVQAWDNF